VLVKVRAAAINPSDVKNVAGAMHGTTLPRIPGRDFAGVVVAGPPELLHREVWGSGGDIGFTRDGSHAECILLPRDAVALKPAAISFESAGSAGVTFVTAWSAVVTSAAVAAGETVVIFGAAGGVGSAAVQIAKALGARVIGAVRSDDEFAGVLQLGADQVVNSQAANFLERVWAVSAGPQVVFDTSGSMFAQAVEIAGVGGRVPVISAPAEGKSTFNLRELYRKRLRVLGVDTRQIDAVGSAKLLEAMSPYFQGGQFKVVSGKAFGLSQAREAYEQASARGGGRVLFVAGV
jgi:NADPH:quinone reductase-like Zn-dependent oxidoreductase